MDRNVFSVMTSLRKTKYFRSQYVYLTLENLSSNNPGGFLFELALKNNIFELLPIFTSEKKLTICNELYFCCYCPNSSNC